MKKTILFALAAVLAGTFAVGGDALARDRHHRGHFDVFIGVPLFAPWPYRPYYGYYPPPVIRVPESPPVYIERGVTAPAPEAYWYYCGSVRGYYPYVKECPEGWQRVAPQPPPPG